IAGIPAAVLLPILSEAPRYFTWLAAQGHLGTVHPWVAVVAGDLGRRIEWRRLGPPRGSGRLLWICEQMAGPLHLNSAVPELFTAARSRGIAAPDWSAGRPPRHCRLDENRYATLLLDRATDVTITEHDGYVAVTCPSRATIATWTGRHYETVSGAGQVPYPVAHHDDPEPEERGVTVFTRRGDYRSTGWLALYNSILH
ncbi:MAG: DEAD/DEAH box helicase, partial [Actinobacteria bacterium]|nr:DEAD/DEAH box helicase [Actinomycetota bacterium]